MGILSQSANTYQTLILCAKNAKNITLLKDGLDYQTLFFLTLSYEFRMQRGLFLSHKNGNLNQMEEQMLTQFSFSQTLWFFTKPKHFLLNVIWLKHLVLEGTIQITKAKEERSGKFVTHLVLHIRPPVGTRISLALLGESCPVLQLFFFQEPLKLLNESCNC